MFKELRARWIQGHRTIRFPKTVPELPERYRGRPVIAGEKCVGECAECIRICPTQALVREGSTTKIDLGRCLFCGECAAACPNKALSFSRDFRLAVRNRGDLITAGEPYELAAELERKMVKLFGRSLKLRQVSAAGCNACEADTNVLSTVVFDLGRFGIQFVASPRHADGILITGPVSKNMKLALLKTYEAVPAPKIVIAVGSCAIAGGPFIGHEEVCDGASGLLPVDLFIPGCPPHPLTILDGLLRLIGRIEAGERRASAV